MKRKRKFFFIISLLYASTCFEHYVAIIRRYYTASGIVKLCRWPSGAQVVDSPLPTCAPDDNLQGVMIPDAV